jgi:autotransporter-associated beta strand protein
MKECTMNHFKRRSRASIRLRLEALENRLAPATHTWTGAAGDGLWSTAHNWLNDSSPAGDTSIVLSFGSAGVGTITDDLAGALNVDELDFTARGYTVRAAAGSSITFTGNTFPAYSDTAGGNTVGVSLAIALSGQVSFYLFQVTSGTSTIDGPISGSGELEKAGLGTLVLGNAANSFLDTVIDAGAIQVNSDGALGAVPPQEKTNIEIDGGTLQFGASFNLNGNRDILLFVGKPDLVSTGAPSGASTQAVSFVPTGTIDTNGFNATIPGLIFGDGSLEKAGAGTLTLTKDNTYTGDTLISAGTLLVDGAQSQSNVFADGGTLGGTGSVGAVTVDSGGVLSPGDSPGLLNTLDVVLNPGSTFAVEIDGTSGGTQYDQLAVTGTVTIDGAGPLPVLDVTLGGGFSSAVGDQFDIVLNDLTDAFVFINGGMFQTPGGTPLPEGTVFTPSGAPAGQQFQISYQGGQGSNDLMLVHINTPPTLNSLTTSPSTIPEGSSVNLSGSFSDPDTLDTHTVQIDWGDNTTTTLGPLAAGVTSFASTHTYDDNLPANAPYTVTVTVIDSNNESASGTTQVTVTNVAPTVTINGAPATGPEGTPINLTSTVTDPSSADTQEGFIFQWTVTKTRGGTTTIFATGTASTLSFTPDDDGIYLVSLQATDKDGGVGTDSVTITVTNVPPQVSSQPDQAAPEGVARDFNLGSFTAATVINGPWTVTVSWGDGTSTTFQVITPGTLPPQSHAFAAESTYGVSVTVRDKDGGTGTGSFHVLVGGFVTGLYRDVLDREPDAAGLQFWVRLNHSGVPRQFIATGFWRSAEHRGLEVDAFYQHLLGRAADGAGRAGWVNAMLLGMSEPAVAVGFLTSPEFMSKHPDRLSFVGGVIQGVLGRPASAAEVVSLASLIDDGVASRARLVLVVLSLDETFVDAILDYYREFLDRIPSATEVQGWLAALRTGLLTSTDASAAFLGSPEYLQRALFEANFVPPVPS